MGEGDVVDRLIAHSAAAPRRPDTPLGPRPTLALAIVACMDARIDLFAILGLRHGDAHILRNAGGVITDDVIRSLTVSQRRLGTQAIVLIHHTDCGLQQLTDDAFRDDLTRVTGVTPPFALQAFTDPYADVRLSMRRIRESPFLAHRDRVRGFVYEVEAGRLHEVAAEG